jgi:hypothetical protein
MEEAASERTGMVDLEVVAMGWPVEATSMDMGREATLVPLCLTGNGGEERDCLILVASGEEVAEEEVIDQHE